MRLTAQTHALSGRVTSGDEGTGPLGGAIVWLKRNGKIKARVVCDADGVFEFGVLSGGLYAVVAGAEAHMKMRTVVTLDGPVAPGGAADLVLPKPLPPDADIGSQLCSSYGDMKSIFQHYCSAAAVGENNPFQMSMTQVNEFMEALKLPDGLSSPGNTVIDEIFSKCNGTSSSTFKLDGRGAVTGALRPDPEKLIDNAMTFDEFLDFQVRLAWCLAWRGALSVKAFPHTRRGLGYALSLYMEEICLARVEKLVRPTREGVADCTLERRAEGGRKLVVWRDDGDAIVQIEVAQGGRDVLERLDRVLDVRGLLGRRVGVRVEDKGLEGGACRIVLALGHQLLVAELEGRRRAGRRAGRSSPSGSSSWKVVPSVWSSRVVVVVLGRCAAERAAGQQRPSARRGCERAS